MRILNTEELRFVYGGHGGRGHKKGHHKVKHACPATTTRGNTTTRRNTTTTRNNKRKHYRA